MDDTTAQMVAKLQTTIRKREEEIVGLKRTINILLQQDGEPPMYGEAELGASSATTSSIKPDTFYGQALNTSIRRILEMRKLADNGPASVRDIYEALTKGGYQFDTKNSDNAMRNLRISLSKSTTAFHRLPNGSYGLLEWYPDVKKPKVVELDEDQDTSDGEGKEPK